MVLQDLPRRSPDCPDGADALIGTHGRGVAGLRLVGEIP